MILAAFSGVYAVKLGSRMTTKREEEVNKGSLYVVVRKRKARKQLDWKRDVPTQEELVELQKFYEDRADDD